MTFRDAITLQDDHAMTEADIKSMMQQRFDRWVAVITAPPPDTNLVVDVEAEPVDELDRA